MVMFRFNKFTIINILTMLIILWLNNGIGSYLFVRIPEPIKLLLIFSWFIIAFLLKRSFAKDLLVKNYLLLIFLIYLLIVKFSLFSTDYDNYILKTSLFLFTFTAIMTYYFDDERIKKNIFKLLLLDYFLISLKTIYMIVKIPGISRYLSMSEENIQKILNASSVEFLGVGNYAYAYSLVIVATFFLYSYFEHKNLAKLIIYMYIFFVLLKMEFTMSIIFLLVFSFIFLITKMPKKNMKDIFLLYLLIAVGSILLISFKSILEFITLNFDEKIGVKLGQLLNFLNGKDISGTDLEERMSYYLLSIRTFIKNPIMGSVLNQNNIGEHSTWLDFLGRYGMFSLPIFLFLIKQIKNLVNSFFSYRTYIYICYIYFFILGIFNTVYISRLFIVVIVFIPCSIIWLGGKNENKNLLDSKYNDFRRRN
ncbi:hypothetical protein [Vagococcus fluvialis]|uniref:hypothetical protein n=1 Tax=Vagococcus fluvialis TaxID=2738 RepID=UPI001D0BA1AA|nr:hypothetical protein [Vagococcus fluvialis]UDM78972.1 hypothetical protein K5K97_09645 [Vagococcus fluvialis]